MVILLGLLCVFFSSRRRHTSWPRDWSSDVCSSDLVAGPACAVWARPSPAGTARIALAGSARSAAACARAARCGTTRTRSAAAKTAAAGPARAGAGVRRGDGLDAHLDAHDAAVGVGDVLGGRAAVEGRDQTVGAEAEHKRGAAHLVHVGVRRDQRPAGAADLGELVEDRRPVAAHLVGVRAPRCLLGRGGTRCTLPRGAGRIDVTARAGLRRRCRRVLRGRVATRFLGGAALPGHRGRGPAAVVRSGLRGRSGRGTLLILRGLIARRSGIGGGTLLIPPSLLSPRSRRGLRAAFAGLTGGVGLLLRDASRLLAGTGGTRRSLSASGGPAPRGVPAASRG